MIGIMKLLSGGLGATALFTVVFGGEALMPLSFALIVGSGVWYLSAKLKALEVGQNEIVRRISALERAVFNDRQ